MKPERCQATAASGKPCSATPRPGRPFCLWHDPEAGEARRELSRKGGKGRMDGMTSMKGRLDRLWTVWHRRPPGCFSEGPSCTKHELVGDGSDDPPMPHLPATCADCGRPVFWRVTVVCGVDVARI